METALRPFLRKLFRFNWKFGLFLLLLVGIPRFIFVLRANVTASYGAIGAIMFVSALTPFLFLTKQGRRACGIRKTSSYSWLLYSFAIGLLFSFILHYLGKSLYGNGYENWYHYIGRSYNIPAVINASDKAILFAIMAGTGMIFSPIGEEFFFRGIVHAAFTRSIGESRASIADSAAFALVHVSHFGLVFLDNHWQFLVLPALIWVTGMFVVSRLFFLCKQKTNSIWGAVVCHAAFNLGMIYCIFYLM